MQQSDQDKPKSSLQIDAAEVRRQFLARGQILEPVKFPTWKKIILFGVFLGTLTAAVLLLIFEQNRKQIVARVAHSLIATYSDQNPQVFRLPPPPPKSAEPRVIHEGGYFATSDEEFEGVLYASSDQLVDEGAQENGEMELAPPAKTKESQKAYDFLAQNSPLAQKLRQSSLGGYELREWRPVKDDSPVFLIDLVVVRQSDNRELHLIWEVDLSRETVRPLSQAARDLED